MKPMYSQNDEEKWITEYYNGYVGKFIDVGANDGERFSCTRRLVELGWSGICIDPSPSAFVQLLNLYHKNPKIISINCALDVDSEIKEFYHRPNGHISTLSSDFKKQWMHLKDKYQTMYLKTITFDEVLHHFDFDCDFIKIDAEGMDFEIMQTIPFNKLPKLNMICIEYCRGENLDNMLSFGDAQKFKPLTMTKHNLIMVKRNRV